jgi:hypothetical protein
MTAGTNVDAGGWPGLVVLMVMFKISKASKSGIVALPGALKIIGRDVCGAASGGL